MVALSCALALFFAASALCAPAPPPITLAWPLHGSEGANGVGGWASSEVPVGAQFRDVHGLGEHRQGVESARGLGPEFAAQFPEPFPQPIDEERRGAIPPLGMGRGRAVGVFSRIPPT